MCCMSDANYAPDDQVVNVFTFAIATTLLKEEMRKCYHDILVSMGEDEDANEIH